MAEEVEMTPVDMTPVAAEPPKVNPLAKPAAAVPKLKPGLKLPPKPGLATGLKLPPKPGSTVTAMRPGLKLPPKPGATISALRPGLKLPTKPGATVGALKPGLKLPPKPGATAASRPIIRKPGEPTASPSLPKPLETLKSVTQKLKGITQQVPQEAILRKTGIITEPAGQAETLKEAAKHKTARISLSDAMGVAPVKDEPTPMKTIRIKRPVNLPGVAPTATTAPTETAAAPVAAPVAETAAAKPTSEPTLAPVETPASAAPAAPASTASAAPSVSVTQRKTLKISRPGTAVRPTGKFGIKKPSQATTVAKKPVEAASPAADGEVADIPDLPPVTAAPVPQPVVEAKSGFGTSLAVVVKLAATVAIGALAWLLYENTQLPTYCGGLGWGQ